jgi:hypothetical protein
MLPSGAKECLSSYANGSLPSRFVPADFLRVLILARGE